MTNKVKIFKAKDGTCIVQAISLQKGDGYLFVPSPYGTETMVFGTVEEAVSQIEKSGYEYYMANDAVINDNTNAGKIDYNKIVDVLIKNLSHENLEIRTTAINSISKFGTEIADKLTELLKTEKSWLAQQSIIKCMEKIISENKNSAQIFLPSLIEISESEYTMVKSAALKAIEKICDQKNE